MADTLDIMLGKKQISVIALALWLLIIVIFMLFARAFDLQIFFVLGFMGLLAIAELMGPSYVKPGFLKYIRYLLGAGLLVFGAIVVVNIIKILHQLAL